MSAWHYFISLLVITVGLFVVALMLPKKRRTQTALKLHALNNNSANSPVNTHLIALASDIKAYFKTHNLAYQLHQSDRYLTISHMNQRKLLITLDTTLPNHQRKLDGVTIVNFQTLPSSEDIIKILNNSL